MPIAVHAVVAPWNVPLTDAEHSLALYGIVVAAFALGAALLRMWATRTDVSPRYRPAALTGVGVTARRLRLLRRHRRCCSCSATTTSAGSGGRTTPPTFAWSARFMDWSVSVPLLVVELIAVSALAGRLARRLRARGRRGGVPDDPARLHRRRRGRRRHGRRRARHLGRHLLGVLRRALRRRDRDRAPLAAAPAADGAQPVPVGHAAAADRAGSSTRSSSGCRARCGAASGPPPRPSRSARRTSPRRSATACSSTGSRGCAPHPTSCTASTPTRSRSGSSRSSSPTAWRPRRGSRSRCRAGARRTTRSR